MDEREWEEGGTTEKHDSAGAETESESPEEPTASAEDDARSRRISLVLGAFFTVIAVGFLALVVPGIDKALESKTVTVVVGGAAWEIEGEEGVDRVRANAGASLESEQARIRRGLQHEYHTGVDWAFEAAIDQVPAFVDEYHSFGGWATRMSLPFFGDLDEYLDEQARTLLEEESRIQEHLDRADRHLREQVLPAEIAKSGARLTHHLADVLDREPSATRVDEQVEADVELSGLSAQLEQWVSEDLERLSQSGAWVAGKTLVATSAVGALPLSRRVLQRSATVQASRAGGIKAAARWMRAPAARIAAQTGAATLATVKTGPMAGVVGGTVFVLATGAEGVQVYRQEQVRAAELTQELEWALLAEREAVKCRANESLDGYLDAVLDAWGEQVGEHSQVSTDTASFRIFGGT
ncbi:hypothetical protein [Thioalkalivibrio halophilus]|uniref:Uncharacterized protein n=1 Tax=Thioalkalivibrio halophilus TaxID=252474 RepID=A0A1V2ZY39_9GAMM|nr:hypothetical protein [Thioalkalivibrio halophilus]OOC10034.1 hypothetical protein B1A74_07945 [Thioalkalivibrio halophilus]